jgi:hypothetical protein
MYNQSINSIKHQKIRHLGLGVLFLSSMILPKEVELGVVPQNRTMRRGTAGASHVFRELYAAVNIKKLF